MSEQHRQISLWDVEDVTGFGRVSDMTIGPVEQIDVREFCRRWHYSSSGGAALWNYGLFDGDVLVGVVAYNLPTPQTCQSVFGVEHQSHVAHMGRLACAEDTPRNVESRLISGSLKLLSADKPELWAVLTFAATGVGHIGYVYQATNAIYTGTGGDTSYWIDDKGVRRSTRTVLATDYARVEAHGWIKHREPLKHRYVYILGGPAERRQRRQLLKLPSLPYPKVETPNREETS